jgi:hypothetical protein
MEQHCVVNVSVTAVCLSAVLCCRIHENGNCGAEISKHLITACITIIVPQHQTVLQYVPSCKGQTVPEVNCKGVAFVLLFHSIMRVNQRATLEMQNKTKNVPCTAVYVLFMKHLAI